MSIRNNPEVERLLHAWREVNSGRGQHGDFLRSFAAAFVNADDEDLLVLLPAAIGLADKYDLLKYAPPSRSVGQADGHAEEAPHG